MAKAPYTYTVKYFTVWWVLDGKTTGELVEGTSYDIVNVQNRNGWPLGSLVIWNKGRPTIFRASVWIRMDQISGPAVTRQVEEPQDSVEQEMDNATH